MHRLSRKEVVVVVALGLLVATTFLPWIRSGTVLRDSYQAARSADRLGLTASAAGQVAFRIWFAVPLMATVAFLLLVLQRRLTAMVVAGTAAALVAAASVVVITSGTALGVGVMAAPATAGFVAGSLVALRKLEAMPRDGSPGVGAQ